MDIEEWFDELPSDWGAIVVNGEGEFRLALPNGAMSDDLDEVPDHLVLLAGILLKVTNDQAWAQGIYDEMCAGELKAPIDTRH